MLWQEKSGNDEYEVPDNVQDLSFQFNCSELPVDHAWLLANAVTRALPWIDEEKEAAIHSIHGATSGNGWTRPRETPGSLLQLPRRTRLYIRLPKHRLDEAAKLAGTELDLGDFTISLGPARPRKLVPSTTVFTRSWCSANVENEDDFTREAVEALGEIGITPGKMLCGLSHDIHQPGATLTARSVLLADLDIAEGVKLQQLGIGKEKLLGCGIFLPHKSLAAVGASQENS
jgi:CRISPR-associated protein Cas6